MLVEPILADLDFTGGDGVLAFVNGMGAHPAARALPHVRRGRRGSCEKAGVRVARSLVGTYITSLDMAGCSVTLLKLDDELLRLWDAPVNTRGLRWGVVRVAETVDPAELGRWLRAFADAVTDHADELTRARLGDRRRRPRREHATRDDRRGRPSSTPPRTPRPAALLKTAGMTLVSTVGGASGPLVRHVLPADGDLGGRPRRARRGGVRRRAAGRPRGRRRPGEGPARATRRWWTRWPRPSTRSTPRWPTGQRTRRRAARPPRRCATQGADATIPLVARKGRASYLGERSAGHRDPGATSTALLRRTRRRRASGERPRMTGRPRRDRRGLAQPGAGQRRRRAGPAR